jgi:plastocyanin
VRYARLLVAVISVLALAACSSAAAPTWTYAPAPPSTPPPAASASPAASAPSAAPSGAASGSPATDVGATVTIVATTATKFDTPAVETAKDKPFTLVFDNQDPTASHNVIVSNPDGSPVQMGGDTSFFTGPAERRYTMPGLKAGEYPFHCQVHPTTMTGTLTAK